MRFQEITNKSKNLSIIELKTLIGNILRNVDYNSICCTNQTFKGLYRARQHSQADGENDDYIFTNEKEYWNPPSQFIKERGRCNDVGESLFIVLMILIQQF